VTLLFSKCCVSMVVSVCMCVHVVLGVQHNYLFDGAGIKKVEIEID
jgi:hypothetical protein